MRPTQIMLRKEFKEINNELDDILMNTVAPKVQAIVVDEMTKFYNDVNSKIELVKVELKKINRDEDIDNTDCERLLKELRDMKLEDYENNIKDSLDKETFNGIPSIMDRIDLLIGKACHLGGRKQGVMVYGWRQAVVNKITDILNMIIEDSDKPYIEVANIEIINLNECVALKREQLLENEDLDIDKKCQIQKIFNYKEMNKFAMKNGFEEVRQTGDHKIFSNGTDSIPIPQHELGKGLSMKIQKQIDMCNKKMLS